MLQKGKWTILWLLLLTVVSASAQRERNYVYMFDCTASMHRLGIWQQTKDWLQADINGLQDGHITIIPFHQDVLPHISFDRAAYQPQEVNKAFDQHIKQSKRTNICDTWNKGMTFIDPHKDNYLYVLTDGEDNVKRSAHLCQLIRQWCGMYPNSYVFYVMLSDEAQVGEIKNAIDACDEEYYITDHIKPFGAFDKSTIEVNTQDYRPRTLAFSAAGTFNATITCQDALFNVSMTQIQNGSAQFTVAPRTDEAHLKEALNGQEAYEFDVTVTSDQLNILNKAIHVTVINKPERILNMAGDELDLGKASHYDSFLFWDESIPDTLTVSLQTCLNDEAQKCHSQAHMMITSETLSADDFTLYINGEEKGDKTFTIDETTNETQLSIIFSSDAPKGKHYFTIKSLSNNKLDKINEASVKAFELPLRAKYSGQPNPLAVTLSIIGLIIACLLILWFAIIRPIRYPTFKVVRIMLTGDASGYQNYRIKGAREIRFTTSGKDNQGWLNRLFTGKVITKQNPISDGSDWYAKPRNSRGTRGASLFARGYTVEPSNTPTNRDQNPTIMTYNNQRIEIKLL